MSTQEQSPMSADRRYVVDSTLGVIGHTGAELERKSPGARTWVLVPGPAFGEAWAILAKAHELTPQLLAELGAGGTPAAQAAAEANLPHGLIAQSIRASQEQIERLRIRLRDEEGNVVADEGITIDQFPPTWAAIPDGARTAIEAQARSLGFPGEPPYYVVMVGTGSP